MPKTWDEGPPRTTRDGWLFMQRQIVGMIASAGVVHGLQLKEEWQAEIKDEEIDRYAALAKRILRLALKGTPRSDGKDWEEAPDSEDDVWTWERLQGILPTTCGILGRRLRGEGEEWKQPDGDTMFTDEEILWALQLSRRVQASVDRAVPRFG